MRGVWESWETAGGYYDNRFPQIDVGARRLSSC